jgi:hypothetical protein
MAKAGKEGMKHVQVRLEKDDHEALVAEMKERGIKALQVGVLEAIRAWTKGGGNLPFGKITKTEEHYLAAVLHYIREDRGILMSTLDELVKRRKSSR